MSNININPKYVYLLQCTEDDGTIRYKIGVSKNVKKRIKQLQTGNVYDIVLLESFYSNYATRIESNLHNLYSHQKNKREWFDLNKEQVESFQNICEKYEKSFDLIISNNGLYL